METQNQQELARPVSVIETAICIISYPTKYGNYAVWAGLGSHQHYSHI